MSSVTHLSCDKGMTFRREVVWPDGGDLTGFLAFLQVRDHPGRVLQLDLSIGAGLSIDVPTSKISIDLDPAATSTLTPGIYQYDLVVQSPVGERKKLISGSFVVNDTITEI